TARSARPSPAVRSNAVTSPSQTGVRFPEYGGKGTPEASAGPEPRTGVRNPGYGGNGTPEGGGSPVEHPAGEELLGTFELVGDGLGLRLAVALPLIKALRSSHKQTD